MMLGYLLKEEVMNMYNLIPWRRNQKQEVCGWDPFEDMHTLMRSMERGWPMLSDSSLLGGVAKWTPAVDIKETEKEILVSASVPGVDKKDIHVDLENDILTIRGERRLDKEYEDKEGVKRIEQSYGSFTRSFSLPAPVDGEAVSAEVKDGVLRVRLPKTEKSRGQSIEVK